MTATIRIHVNRYGLQAETYLIKRGGDLLLHYFKRIYRDQYRAIDQLEIKAGVNNFLASQMDCLRRRAISPRP